MTNDIIKAEILPPLPQNIPSLPGDGFSVADEAQKTGVNVPSDIEASFRNGSAPGAATSVSSSSHILRAVKFAMALFAAAVFILAIYTEVSSAIAGFVPDSFSDAVAAIAFGGSYASADLPETPDNSVMRPPNSHPGGLFTEWDGNENNRDPDESGSQEDPDGSSTSGDSIPDSDRYPIVARDLSTNAKRGLVCSNQTEYDLDLDYFADNEFALPPLSELTSSFPPDTVNPVVLIVHTHGTECYAEEGADSYSKKDNSRTTDITKNVVAVGEVMAEYFESCGINTVHCTEMFDRDSYIDAYDNSAAAVREYLAIYPSIRYIFDVHRDSIIADDYTKYRPVTEIDGTPTAQFMCVVGTNAKGADHPLWRDNLTLAAHLQVRLWNCCESLPRRISVRSASFYQQYAQGSLLLEIGSCGNTLSEAKACARLVAEQLALIIIAGE